MTFTLPALPYALDALAPHISAATLEMHHGRHHATYVRKLNELTQDTDLAAAPIESLVRGLAPGPLFNNAAQHWNHSFYWRCLSPEGGGHPAGPVADGIRDAFGNLTAFRDRFNEAARGIFGSGWAWLVRDRHGQLAVRSTSNAENPLRRGELPLLTCDMWEHAYYLDYRNGRPSYLEAFWHLVNWDLANEQLASVVA
jgi:Fe-Mn family superoxide dismutase